MSDFPCCEPAGAQVGQVFDAVALENVRLRDEFTKFKTLTAAIEKKLSEKLAAEQAEILKRDLVIQNLWARNDELVAERNAMAAHINQLAEDWQNEREHLTQPINYGLDQGAVDWARGHVERVRDKWRKWEHESRDKGDEELMMRCRRIANVLEMELIGGKGCVITPFDERLPLILRAVWGDRAAMSDERDFDCCGLPTTEARTEQTDHKAHIREASEGVPAMAETAEQPLSSLELYDRIIAMVSRQVLIDAAVALDIVADDNSRMVARGIGRARQMLLERAEWLGLGGPPA